MRIARRGIESSTRLGRHRWKAERSIAWLAGCRRLRIRYDRDSERFFAFAMLACDAAVLQPAALRSHRSVTMIPVPECPLKGQRIGLSRTLSRQVGRRIAMAASETAYWSWLTAGPVVVARAWATVARASLMTGGIHWP